MNTTNNEITLKEFIGCVSKEIRKVVTNGNDFFCEFD